MKQTMTSTHKMILGAFFIVLGILIPYFVGHAAGIPGTILLPMHLSVFIAGMILGPKRGALCGLITPILSGLLTGMPVFFPMMPIMACELATYGFVSGVMRDTLKKPIYVALLSGMIAGRIVYGVVFSLLLFATNGAMRAPSVLVAITTGLPGIGLQLAIVPAIVYTIEKAIGKSESRQRIGMQITPFTGEAYEKAVALIKREGTSVVLIKNDTIIHTDDGRGVSALIRLYESHPDKLKDAIVVDRMIGKAAAMILILAGVKAVYGETFSVAGKATLEAEGIDVKYNRVIDMISNREGNGICPFERSVLDCQSPEEAYEKLTQTYHALKIAQ